MAYSWLLLVAYTALEEVTWSLKKIRLIMSSPFMSLRMEYMASFSWVIFCPLIDLNAMHYRLRPIKWGQFRFSNFPSHFISVQIFQIDLSTLPLILSVSKYFRYAFRTQNESFSSSTAIIKQLGEEKGTS